ncbi:hypothetical protein C2845_PM15G02350 [Panicum miliaceum]|uniref:Uncharacterized protein n=1 Tax=Panicum miliaceum TaxID=4540 RepID=A0A3L6Q5I4_PANMI|nr:hypothetical protein C2845_PM15G02350 [Panicum miliaceum]
MGNKRSTAKGKGKEMKFGAPPVSTWKKRYSDQVRELLGRIKALKYRGVTGASIMYSWIGRRVQPLQKRDPFSFDYLSRSDPSCFSIVKIHPTERVLRDNINVYRSMAPIPEIDCPEYLVPLGHRIKETAHPDVVPESEEEEDSNDDRTLAERTRRKAVVASEGVLALRSSPSNQR